MPKRKYQTSIPNNYRRAIIHFQQNSLSRKSLAKFNSELRKEGLAPVRIDDLLRGLDIVAPHWREYHTSNQLTTDLKSFGLRKTTGQPIYSLNRPLKRIGPKSIWYCLTDQNVKVKKKRCSNLDACTPNVDCTSIRDVIPPPSDITPEAPSVSAVILELSKPVIDTNVLQDFLEQIKEPFIRGALEQYKNAIEQYNKEKTVKIVKPLPIPPPKMRAPPKIISNNESEGRLKKLLDEQRALTTAESEVKQECLSALISKDSIIDSLNTELEEARKSFQMKLENVLREKEQESIDHNIQIDGLTTLHETKLKFLEDQLNSIGEPIQIESASAEEFNKLRAELTRECDAKTQAIIALQEQKCSFQLEQTKNQYNQAVEGFQLNIRKHLEDINYLKGQLIDKENNVAALRETLRTERLSLEDSRKSELTALQNYLDSVKQREREVQDLREQLNSKITITNKDAIELKVKALKIQHKDEMYRLEKGYKITGIKEAQDLINENTRLRDTQKELQSKISALDLELYQCEQNLAAKKKQCDDELKSLNQKIENIEKEASQKLKSTQNINSRVQTLQLLNSSLEQEKEILKRRVDDMEHYKKAYEDCLNAGLLREQQIVNIEKEKFDFQNTIRFLQGQLSNQQTIQEYTLSEVKKEEDKNKAVNAFADIARAIQPKTEVFNPFSQTTLRDIQDEKVKLEQDVIMLDETIKTAQGDLQQIKNQLTSPQLPLADVKLEEEERKRREEADRAYPIPILSDEEEAAKRREQRKLNRQSSKRSRAEFNPNEEEEIEPKVFYRPEGYSVAGDVTPLSEQVLVTRVTPPTEPMQLEVKQKPVSIPAPPPNPFIATPSPAQTAMLRHRQIAYTGATTKRAPMKGRNVKKESILAGSKEVNPPPTVQTIFDFEGRPMYTYLTDANGNPIPKGLSVQDIEGPIQY